MGIMMFAGYTIKKAKLTNAVGEKMLNDIVYWLLMPSLLFYNIVTCPDLGEADIGFFVLDSTVIAISILVVAVLIRKWPKQRRVSALTCMCRTNMSVYGSAVALSMLAEADAKLAMLYLSYAVAIQNVFLVSALEFLDESKPNPVRVIIQTIKNPSVIATIAAVLLNVAGVELPEVIFKPLSDFSKCATPMAFLMIGVGFCWMRDRQDRHTVLLIAAARLILIPAALILPALALFKIEGAEYVALLSTMATPCAVSNASLSEQFGGNALVTNESVILTSALSIFSFPLFVYLGILIG